MKADMQNNGIRGVHIIVDISGIPYNDCEDDRKLLMNFIDAARISDTNVINTARYHFGHNSPAGCSVFVMLDESHLSAHSYASEGLMAIDIFVCGCEATNKANRLLNALLKKIPHEKAAIQSIRRFTAQT